MIPILVSIWFSYFFVFLLPLNEFPFISIIFILLCFFYKKLFYFLLLLILLLMNLMIENYWVVQSLFIFGPFDPPYQQESTTIKTPEENKFFFLKR